MIIAPIGSDFIIENKSEENYNDANNNNKHCLSQFTHTGFAVYFAICANHQVQEQPEQRDKNYSDIEVSVIQHLADILRKNRVGLMLSIQEE